MSEESRDDRLKAIESVLTVQLEEIGRTIGYGRAQQILGDLWDQDLARAYGAGPGRGKLGVTSGEALAYQRGRTEVLAAWDKHVQDMARTVKAAIRQGST